MTHCLWHNLSSLLSFALLRLSLSNYRKRLIKNNSVRPLFRFVRSGVLLLNWRYIDLQLQSQLQSPQYISSSMAIFSMSFNSHKLLPVLV